MPVESYNDMGSPDGAVGRTGSRGGSQPAGARPSATGTPKAVEKSEGTDSPRITVTTKRAELPHVVPDGKGRSGRGRDWPEGVQSFIDDDV